MLSLFPTLLSWEELAPLLIRLVLGAIFIYWSYKRLSDKSGSGRSKAIGAVDGILAVLLVIGLWTQLAAIIVAIDLIVRIIKKVTEKAFLTQGVNYYLVLLVLAISLIVSGAGWVAFDLGL